VIEARHERDTVDPERVRDALRGVIDPETGLDVVTMGLVYEIETDGGDVRIVYTLTTPGCPMGNVLELGIRAAAGRVAGVESVRLELTWEPAWNPGMMERAG